MTSEQEKLWRDVVLASLKSGKFGKEGAVANADYVVSATKTRKSNA